MVVPGVPNAGVVKEAAVAVVCLEDAAVGELAVEDPEAVEVVEVVEVNQGNKIKQCNAKTLKWTLKKLPSNAVTIDLHLIKENLSNN